MIEIDLVVVPTRLLRIFGLFRFYVGTKVTGGKI